MPYENHLVDLTKLPENTRDAYLQVARQFNAFVSDIGTMKQDVDRISGATAAEKDERWQLFALLGTGWHWILKKQGPSLVLVILLVTIARHLGVPTEHLYPWLLSLFSLH